MNTFAGVWILTLTLNGYTIDYDTYRTNAACEDHRKTVERAFKQSETNGILRCTWREKQQKENK